MSVAGLLLFRLLRTRCRARECEDDVVRLVPETVADFIMLAPPPGT